jgi:hypothetical protein
MRKFIVGSLMLITIPGESSFAQQRNTGPGEPESTAVNAALFADQEKKDDAVPPKPVEVSGRIVKGDGSGVPNCELKFTQLNGKFTQTTTTGANGNFAFAAPAGKYKVLARVGPKTKPFDVSISADKLEPATLVFE